LAERLAAALPVLVAPVVGFGYYPAFVEYPGSQHLRAETFIALVEDLIGNLIDHGAARIAILNTGVSTEAPLRIAARNILERRRIRVATADLRTLGRGADRLLRQRGGGHADERETSLMLAIAPEAVRMDRAEREPGEERPPSVFRFPVVLSGKARGDGDSRSGASGDPTLATRETGEAILAEILRELIGGLKAAFPDAFGAA
jgi:creatinine amidohydrolase